MDLATRSDIQELRGEFNQRFDTLDERVDGLVSEVASLRATLKTIGWVVATLIAAIGVALVAAQVFG